MTTRSAPTDRLRIVTTGLAVTYPMGGVFWDYLQYPLGLRQLGHEVLYLEDTGKWCYDPQAQSFVEDGARNAAWFASQVARLDPGLADRFSFRDVKGNVHGRSWSEVVRFCANADLFLHISASCWMRDEHCATRRIAFIDSDPLYTQAGILGGATPEEIRGRIDWYQQHHHVFFTFGENIGAPGCKIPVGPFAWVPTRQPIVLDCFVPASVPVAARRPVLTTVASWEPTEKGPVIDGVAYRGKSAEFERFLDLPARSALPLEVALSGPAPVDRLRARGWRIRAGQEVSGDPWTYRDYLAGSTGEWSVAKNAYVASRSGWFSCRTACYLALGVPAVVQDTGFGRDIPTGEGVLTFTDLDSAAAAIGRLAQEPERHSAAARAIAERCFDSRRVLTRLIEDALR
jgi:hypothetical protein